MITFLSPGWLWALLAVPALAVVLVLWARDRRRAAAAFSDPALLPVRAPRGVRRLRTTAGVLLLLAIACGPVALAQPVLDRTEKEQRGNIMIAIDVSRSMDKTDLSPSRRAAAVEAAKRFLDAAPKSTAVGLIVFADGAQVRLPPTTDRALMVQALDNLGPSRVGSAIGDAVVTGIAALKAAGVLETLPVSPRESAGRILLLTDGANSAGLDPVAAAERAKGVRVPVYTVLLGDDPGRPGEPTPPETLATLATQTGGVFVQSTTTDDLVQVFTDLGGSLTPVQRITQLTVWVVLLALVLLGAAAGAMALAHGRPERRPHPAGLGTS